MATITRTITGDVDDLTAVTLLTLVRTDSGASVSFAGGGAFTHSGSNWSISFTAPASNLTYAYTYRRTFADGTHIDGAGTLYDSADPYVGRYVTETELGVAMNRYNLNAQTDLDSDGVRDAGAVEQVIKRAEGRVDFYTGGPFTFSSNLNGEIAAETFGRWATELAVDLAVNKRAQVTSDANAAMAKRIAGVIAEMQAFAGGEMLLPGAIPANGPLIADEFVFDAVTAVGPTVNPDGTNLNNWPRLSIDGGRLNYG